MKRLLLLIVLFSSFTLSQQHWKGNDDPPMGDDGGVKWGRKGGVMKELKLTDDQVDQFRKFHSEFQKKQIQLRADIQTMRITLKDLFMDDAPDREKIKAQVADISKDQNDLKENGIEFWFKVNTILTSDQKEIWKKHLVMMAEERQMNRMNHPGNMMHRPGMRRAGPPMHGRGME